MGNGTKLIATQFGRTQCKKFAALSVLALFGLAHPKAVQAGVGQIRVETSSFLRTSSDGKNFSSTFVAGPKVQGEGPVFQAGADVRAYLFLEDPSGSFTPEATNLYVASSPVLMPRHQITLGRRQMDLSEIDNRWNLGIWNPRFIWDPLRPERVGLLGLFYTYQSRGISLTVYGSPVSIPERGFPIKNSDGSLSAGRGQFVSPPKYVDLGSGVTATTNYNIIYPSMSEALLRPAGMVNLRVGEDTGGWGRLAYGYMPVHQANTAVDGTLNASTLVFNANVIPLFGQKHVLTGEAGYHLDDQASAWFSVTREVPVQRALPATWVVTQYQPASIFGAGGSYGDGRLARVSAAYLYVREEQAPASGGATLATSGRFLARRALQLSAQFFEFSPWNLGVNGTVDIENTNGVLSLDVGYRTRSGWRLGAGTDFILSSTGRGWYGQWEGDDRFRGSVSYVF